MQIRIIFQLYLILIWSTNLQIFRRFCVFCLLWFLNSIISLHLKLYLSPPILFSILKNQISCGKFPSSVCWKIKLREGVIRWLPTRFKFLFSLLFVVIISTCILCWVESIIVLENHQHHWGTLLLQIYSNHCHLKRWCVPIITSCQLASLEPVGLIQRKHFSISWRVLFLFASFTVIGWNAPTSRRVCVTHTLPYLVELARDMLEHFERCHCCHFDLLDFLSWIYVLIALRYGSHTHTVRQFRQWNTLTHHISILLHFDKI